MFGLSWCNRGFLSCWLVCHLTLPSFFKHVINHLSTSMCCMYMHVYVLPYVWMHINMCAWMCKHKPTILYLKAGFLEQSRACWGSSHLVPRILYFCLPALKLLWDSMPSSIFVGLGIWTWALTLVQQVLYQFSHPSGPLQRFITLVLAEGRGVHQQPDS